MMRALPSLAFGSLAILFVSACSSDDTTAASTQAGSSTSVGASTSVGGTGGTGGATGGSSSVGGTGVGGTGVGGTGVGGSVACTWSLNTNSCGDGMYCDAPGCMMGTCAGIPSAQSEKGDKMPVCGCDGVTYWNDKVSATHGMAINADGACTATGLLCGGMSGMMCPTDTFCVISGDATVCQAADLAGTCWAVPSTCPMTGSLARSCQNMMCGSECDLIKNGQTYYPDATCM